MKGVTKKVVYQSMKVVPFGVIEIHMHVGPKQIVSPTVYEISMNDGSGTVLHSGLMSGHSIGHENFALARP
jgi:hypothetical protein